MKNTPATGKNIRTESDSIGDISVDNSNYWGAQTQRSLGNFPIGDQKMPTLLVHAFALQKKSAAEANHKAGLLDETLLKAMNQAADEIIAGQLDDHFPLVVWQTGSGTQSNMNLNEVISNRANEILGYDLGLKKPVHPNDHVNRSQSSNDSFPTAMHIAGVLASRESIIPALEKLIACIDQKAKTFDNIIKIGRTHMQDATPLTIGQELGAFVFQLKRVLSQITHYTDEMQQCPQGGTAVGTGLNTPDGFDTDFCHFLNNNIKAKTKKPTEFVPMKDKFAGLASHDVFLDLSGSLNTLATILLKLGNDIRLLSCGPRCGIGEMIIPANEPGSSIMPGKVNPTQIEALTMVCAQIMGNHTTITIANSQGHLQLNVYKPVIIYNLLQSIELLADAMNSFVDRCLDGLVVNEKRVKQLLNESLMLVTSLTPVIGYDNAGKIAKYAYEHDLTLKQAALKLELIDEATFDKATKPEKMIGR